MTIPAWTEDRAEDLQWLADTGENARGAAERLGLNYKTLERWAGKHMPDVWHVLISRNPRDLAYRTAGNQWRSA